MNKLKTEVKKAWTEIDKLTDNLVFLSYDVEEGEPSPQLGENIRTEALKISAIIRALTTVREDRIKSKRKVGK
jgi:hypothetical protein